MADAAFGGVDVLVNNAGIMRLASLADSDDALLDSHVAINLKGSFNALREASRRLRNRGASLICRRARPACFIRATAFTPPQRRQSRP